MKRLEFRPRARADLANISRYTIRHWGRSQARSYLERVNTTAERLAGGVLNGRPTPYVGLRMQRAESHVIYYVDGQEMITVVRILHERMDAERHLRR